MREFVYLYRITADAPITECPRAADERRMKWTAWLRYLTAGGHAASLGHPLEAGAVVNDARRARGGPYAESGAVIIGYTIVKAETLESAIELASRCPLLEIGGLVEVRPVAAAEDRNAEAATAG